jgi:uncharacterized protein
MAHDAAFWIDALQLAPHPEGGHYRVTYGAELTISREALPPAFKGARPASTAIYFLVDGQNFSAFHRIASDELWHFYAGSGLLIHVIAPDGALQTIRLGNDPSCGQTLQASVPAGCWFASELENPDTYALVGCTVAPGFDFEDFQLANRGELSATFPQHSELIARLTRE